MKYLRFLCILAMIFFGFAMSGCTSEGQKITTYTYMCGSDLDLGFLKDHYVVFPTNQEVVAYDKDFATYRFKDCSVADKKTWKCNYNDDSGWVEVRNGEKITDVFGEYSKYRAVTVPVSVFTYWLGIVTSEGARNKCKEKLEHVSNITNEHPGLLDLP